MDINCWANSSCIILISFSIIFYELRNFSWISWIAIYMTVVESFSFINSSLSFVLISSISRFSRATGTWNSKCLDMFFSINWLRDAVPFLMSGLDAMLTCDRSKAASSSNEPSWFPIIANLGSFVDFKVASRRAF